jgi:phospholipase C
MAFIEEWQAAKGVDVKSNETVPWRRDNMANLVNAFDFENPDYSVPDLPQTPAPHKNVLGVYDGSAYCASRYGSGRPPVPYTGVGANNDTSGLAEKGFKPVRGLLTEGRNLVLESSGFAISAAGHAVSLRHSTKNHDDIHQGWILHAVAVGGNKFTVSSAANGLFICNNLKLCKDSKSASVLSVEFKPSHGHSLKCASGRYLAIGKNKKLSWEKLQAFWNVFSVTY